MDLGAYAQIENLDKIAKDNNIEVPRLRGYRLMKTEEPVNIEELIKERNLAVESCETLCRADPFWNPNADCATYSSYTDYVCDFFMNKEKDENGWEHYTSVKWDRIHGKKRKILKFEIKKAVKAIRAQYEMWNKYCGRDDVLYIHSRIGGNNWSYFNGPEVAKQPWFLERVNDNFDTTYCDIYAKIKPLS